MAFRHEYDEWIAELTAKKDPRILRRVARGLAAVVGAIFGFFV